MMELLWILLAGLLGSIGWLVLIGTGIAPWVIYQNVRTE